MNKSTWKRNTAGLERAVLDRAEGARTRVEAAIDALAREGRPVNFNSVARRAGVTRAYLYAHASLRDRIVALR